MSRAPLPEFFDYAITDIDSYASILSTARIGVSQLIPGALRGHHTRIRSRSGEISWIETNLPIRGHGALPLGLWTLSLVTRAESRSLQHGAEVRTGSLVIHAPGAAHDGLYGRDFSVVCIGVPCDGFERHFKNLPSARHVCGRDGWSVYHASNSRRQELIEQFEGAARTLREDEVFRGSFAAVDSMIDRLTACFIDGLRDASPSQERLTLRVSSAIVCRAEEMLAHAGEHIPRVPDLCRATGIPRRSLSRAFHLVLGIGPAMYLRRYRLNEARRALVHDRIAGETVTAVALRFGFRHLSRFSGEYRAMFGEVPSVTRRAATAPDDRLGI